MLYLTDSRGTKSTGIEIDLTDSSVSESIYPLMYTRLIIQVVVLLHGSVGADKTTLLAVV